jgi:hypothetical protein
MGVRVRSVAVNPTHTMDPPHTTSFRNRLTTVERRLTQLEQDQARHLLAVRCVERYLDNIGQRILMLHVDLQTDFHRTIGQTIDQLHGYTDTTCEDLRKDMDTGFLTTSNILELQQQRLAGLERDLKDVSRRLGHLQFRKK